MRLSLPVLVLAASLGVACGSASDAGLSSTGVSGEGGAVASGSASGSSGSGGATTQGSGGTTGTGGDASGGATTTCTSSACQAPCSANTDCASNPDGRTVCDTNSGQCVQCVYAATCAPGEYCINHGCTGLGGAGGSGGGGATGSGGATIGSGGVAGGSGGTSGSGGWPNVPAGAWAQCNQDSDCQGGRICTKALQSVIVSGRIGACVNACTIATPGACDPAPAGSATTCVNWGIGVCSLSCINGACADGLDCVLGLCFWKK